MALNGYQLFVRHDDPKAVEKAIRRYVDEVGCKSVVNPDEDTFSPDLAKRDKRVFTVSQPQEGTIAVWEDGSWSDRLMAPYLSKDLGTEAIWLMLSEVTDSWAVARYDKGEEVERRHEEPKDLLGTVEAYAEENKLPYALAYLEDPNEDAEFAAFFEELKGTGFMDIDPADLEMIKREQAEAEARGEGEPVETEEDDEEGETLEELHARVERDRPSFLEFTVPCDGKK